MPLIPLPPSENLRNTKITLTSKKAPELTMAMVVAAPAPSGKPSASTLMPPLVKKPKVHINPSTGRVYRSPMAPYFAGPPKAKKRDGSSKAKSSSSPRRPAPLAAIGSASEEKKTQPSPSSSSSLSSRPSTATGGSGKPATTTATSQS